MTLLACLVLMAAASEPATEAQDLSASRVEPAPTPAHLNSRTIDLRLGVEALSRKVSINGDLFGRFLNYSLAAAPAVAGGAAWFPFARTPESWSSGFGLVGRGEGTFTPRADQGATHLRTSLFDLSGGVAFRHSFGRFTPRAEVMAEYAILDFSSAPAAASAQPLPIKNVIVEPALALGIELTKWLDLALQAGYPAVVESSLGADFRRASSLGVDGTLRLTATLPRSFSRRDRRALSPHWL